ncbi:MAG: queuosine precursor transporter [Pseudomonadales bacterium]|nr:queuosine precursor transporter [Pseudomonadales bacterium]MCP5182898.1 queuosine precursor transporter [Pseudomonadales bacterium]
MNNVQPDYTKRRQRVFLILAGLFLGTLAMLNILGISRFIDLSFTVFGLEIPMVVAVGVLPYPLTFLCTDLICELFGEEKGHDIVWVGLLLNAWVIFILWVGGLAPGFEPMDAAGVPLPDAAGREPVFFEIRNLAFGAVAASMAAYLAAQFCDVRLFHFWKRLTEGKHLWLRNNASTMTSQMVDTTAVILITHFYAHALPVKPGEPIWPQLLTFIASGYAFKLICAALDTLPFYFFVKRLRRYLNLTGYEEATRL